NAGIFPSGGSITIEVRSVLTGLVPISRKASLYVPTTPAFAGRLSVLFLSFITLSQSRASCSVKNSFPLSSSGRSTGVPLALFQLPCRSGWPSGVRGGTHAFFAAGDEALAGIEGVCADAKPTVKGVHPANAIQT